MEKQDFFQEIAMTKHPISAQDKEVKPVPVPDVWFQKSYDMTADYGEIQEASFEKRCEDFNRELEEMRIRHRPFLENHLPGLPKQITKLLLKEFEFRYLEKGETFTCKNTPGKQWESVTVPDYRGPAEENGKWSAFYKCSFSGEDFFRERAADEDGKRAVLAFQCVDYIAEVFVNGNFVGRHEGFFAPFSFDITDCMESENELVILCKNDYTILGTGPVLDGDKIYAATGPGWNDPYTGWHHCPAGAGVFGKVELLYRPEICLDDIFVRPDIDNGRVEVRMGVMNYADRVKEDFELTIDLLPRNFTGPSIGSKKFHITCAGPGKNEYRFHLPVSGFRLWNTEEPWLYAAQAVMSKGGRIITCASQNFGIKKFVSDENSEPKGKFYLNQEPIVLRGANEMGHLQQCVMQGNMEQLVDDILIAKMCHMNYYRVTQRPVQEEIYDYFDMLGMMHQCDLPLFSFLRRPQFSEAVRQAGEMEHLVRRHVSTCMVTFINEPMCIRRTEDPNDKFSKRYELKGHRHLMRDELEAFFAAARKAVYVENPDRVIKNAEGDYDGPTAEGMPDFHSYTMWYTNHGQPIGKMMRGYLPPVKEGWMIGCGEYGAEGLDNEAILQNKCPKEWLGTDENGHWYPDKIVRAQTPSVHGDWYEEQETMADWVRESQIHQANATKLMTDAFRRRGDIISHTAIHLLIDAWPTGWMKSLLDCERQPKRAYFAYQDSLVPRRVNLYTGQSCVYEDETVDVEAWLLNDTAFEGQVTVNVSCWEEGEKQPYAAFLASGVMRAAWAGCMGKIPVSFSSRTIEQRNVYVKAELQDEPGKTIHHEVITFRVYKRQQLEQNVWTMGEEAQTLCNLLTGKSGVKRQDAQVCLCSGIDAESLHNLETYVSQGGRGVLLLPEETADIRVAGYEVKTISCGGIFFAAAEEEYKKYPLRMLYQNDKGYIDYTASYTLETQLPGETRVFTYDKKGLDGSKGAKKHLSLVKECTIGSGTLTLVSLCREGRIGYNPGLDRLLMKIMGNEE